VALVVSVMTWDGVFEHLVWFWHMGESHGLSLRR